MSIAKAPYLARLEMSWLRSGCRCGWFTTYANRALYHAPSLIMMTAASNAAKANQEMACCPKGRMMRAASSGPTAEPPLPPTWKIHCAKLFLPPDANCATRDAVGWNTEEPNPTTLTANRIRK